LIDVIFILSAKRGIWTGCTLSSQNVPCQHSSSSLIFVSSFSCSYEVFGCSKTQQAKHILCILFSSQKNWDIFLDRNVITIIVSSNIYYNVLILTILI